MATKQYLIELPLPDAVSWYTVCRAATAPGAAEVVRAILSEDQQTVAEIRVRVVVLEVSPLLQ